MVDLTLVKFYVHSATEHLIRFQRRRKIKSKWCQRKKKYLNYKYLPKRDHELFLKTEQKPLCGFFLFSLLNEMLTNLKEFD